MPWLAVAAAYLIGSIPCGVIVARLHGVDLRSRGSGNIGATNALRVLGKKAGLLTLAGDVIKGLLAVYLALWFSGPAAGPLAAGAAVLGHDFSAFTGLKGGKGVATSFGVMAALAPKVALVVFCIWLAVVVLWRYSSLGAVVSFALMPVTAFMMVPQDKGLWLLSLSLSLLALFKHRSNIARLVRGDEPKIGATAS